jgi:MFS family permease
MTRPKLNKVILLLTGSDVFTFGLINILNVFVGLYLAEKPSFDEHEVLQIIGIGAAIFNLTNAIFQIPCGYLVDKLKGDKDEIITLALGNFLMGFPLILFPIIGSANLYYFLQFIIGLGAAINLVSWRKLFAKNLDENHEGMQYASYQTVMGLCTSIFGVLAGFLSSISQEYFDLVIISVGILMMFSSFFPLALFKTARKI